MPSYDEMYESRTKKELVVLADQMGVAYRTLHAYYRRERTPSIKMAIKLNDLAGVTFGSWRSWIRKEMAK